MTKKKKTSNKKATKSDLNDQVNMDQEDEKQQKQKPVQKGGKDKYFE
jgi:hypothetical protein